MNSQQRFTEAFSAFTNTLGLFGSDSERTAFVQDTFMRMHRTTQQMFMKVVILPVLRHLCQMYKENWFDARNAASCELAYKMLAAVDSDDLHLPFI